jgi:hypothetical protein
MSHNTMVFTMLLSDPLELEHCQFLDVGVTLSKAKSLTKKSERELFDRSTTCSHGLTACTPLRTNRPLLRPLASHPLPMLGLTIPYESELSR